MYATLAHVSAQAAGRTFTGNTKPTSSQVAIFLTQTAAELNGVLRAKGYEVPVDSSATESFALLQHYNTIGAAAMVEQSAPTGDGTLRAHAWEMWESAKKALAAGTVELPDASKDTTSSVPRYPASASPAFSVGMEF